MWSPRSNSMRASPIIRGNSDLQDEPRPLKLALVVNPVSGRGKSLRSATALHDLLTSRGHEVQLFHSTADMEDLRNFAQGLDASHGVVVIGGDGTLNQFINCAGQYAWVTLFGRGTANVLSIELNLPKRLPAFVHMLEHGETQYLLPGILNGERKFLMMASYGLDAKILALTDQSHKNRFGKLAFLWALLASLRRHDLLPVSWLADDHVPIHGGFVVASRIRHYGGPFCLASQADPCQPGFILVVQTRPGPWATLGLLFSLFCFRRLPRRRDVHIHRVQTVVDPRPDQMLWLQVDGDPCPGPFHSLEVAREPIPFLIPATGMRPRRKP